MTCPNCWSKDWVTTNWCRREDGSIFREGFWECTSCGDTVGERRAIADCTEGGVKVYTVVTTKMIAKEMSRYEESACMEMEFVRLGRIKPTTNEAEATKWVTDTFGADQLDNLLEYRFIFDGKPEVERWLSFGVKPEVVQ